MRNDSEKLEIANGHARREEEDRVADVRFVDVDECYVMCAVAR